MGPSADTLARTLSSPPQRDHYRMIYAMGLKLSSRASPLLPVTLLRHIYTPRIPLYFLPFPLFRATRVGQIPARSPSIANVTSSRSRSEKLRRFCDRSAELRCPRERAFSIRDFDVKAITRAKSRRRATRRAILDDGMLKTNVRSGISFSRIHLREYGEFRRGM